MDVFPSLTSNIDPAENLASNGTDSVCSGNGSPVVYVQIRLLPLMHDIVRALERAAEETATEFDLLPHNLLAAFYRVASHIELFLQVTNPALHHLHGSGTVLDQIQELRVAAAQQLARIGEVLRCPNGYLSQPFELPDTDTCASCFGLAAQEIRSLVETIRLKHESVSSHI